jgi:thiamine pyrophosphokinase
MKFPRRYSLFLNNRYNPEENGFYLKRMKGAITVAVDGGIRFFRKNKIYPDILIGDFDSSPPLSKKYLANIEVISYSPKKDKTDSQLALEMALKRGARKIEIYGAIGKSEIDHTLGNIFLLELVNKFNRDNRRKVSARLVGPKTELALLDNDMAEFEGQKGDYFSIIPLSVNPRVEFAGLKYPYPKRPLRIGDSLSLRNEFLSRGVRVKIDGKAVIVVIHKK